MGKNLIFAYENYRDVLRAEFNDRKARRKAYTLNAFARDLGISSARISSVLHKRYGISPDTASSIARKLRFTVEEEKYFVSLVASEHSRTQFERKHAQEQILK